MATELKNASDSQIASLKSQIAQAQSLLNAQKTAPAVSAPVQSLSSSSGISESQRWYNSTPDASTGLLPDGTKPNTMPSGMSALEQNQWKDQQSRGAAKPVTSVSSTDGTQSRDVILKKIADLEVQKKAQQERDLLNNQNKPPVSSTNTSNTKSYNSLQELQSAGGILGQTHIKSQETGIYMPVNNPELTPEQIKLDEDNAAIDRKQTEYLNQMESLIANADEDTRYSVGVLQNTMQNNMQLMKDYNQRTQDAVFSRMSGSAGFVPGMIESALGQELGQGLLRVSQIESDYQSKIADIKSAATEKQWGRLGDLFDDSIKLKEEKRKALVDLDKKQRRGAIALQNAIKEQEDLDKVHQDNVKSKMETVAPSLYGMMTGNPETDKLTIDMVSKSTGINPVYLYGGLQKYKDDQLKDIDVSQWGGYLKFAQQMGITPSFDDFIKRKAQASKAQAAGSIAIAYANKAPVAGSGGLNAPLSEGARQAVGSGSLPFQGIFNMAMTDNTLGSTKADREQGKINLANSLEAGDYITAYGTLSPLIRKRLGGPLDERITKIYAQRKMYESLLPKLVEAYKSDYMRTNYLNGTLDDMADRFGMLNPALMTGEAASYRDLAKTLGQEFMNYRNTMTGAAFSEAESRGYEQLLPSAKQDINSIIVSINAFNNSAISREKALYENKGILPLFNMAELAQQQRENGQPLGNLESSDTIEITN